MTTLVVVDSPDYAERDLVAEQEVWGDKIVVQRCVFDGDASRLISSCRDADAILTDYAPFSRHIIEELTSCKLISIAATGHNTVDLDAAEEHGICVCVVDEYCTDEVADHTLALILALSRCLPKYHRVVQDKREWKFDAVSGLTRLRGRILGLIGFGRIGQAVAIRAQTFGLQVIAHDPLLAPQNAEKRAVELCDLDTLLERSHIVSLHCYLDASNKGMIDKSAFAKMVNAPILINVARGELIDDQAMLMALEAGQIAGAGLDVLSSESPNLGASGLLHRDNVILTPHAAFYSDESMRQCREVSARNIINHLNGHHEAVSRYVVRPTGDRT